MGQLARAVASMRRVGVALAAFGLLTIAPAAHSQAQLSAPAGAREPRTPQIVKQQYQEWIGRSCPNQQGCLLTFTAVPAAKLLIVTHVSCYFSASGTAAMTFFLLASPTTALIPSLLTTVSGVRYFQSSNEVLAIYQAGEVPLVFVNWAANTSTGMGCMIAGTLRRA